jgi:hypothetical protein
MADIAGSQSPDLTASPRPWKNIDAEGTGAHTEKRDDRAEHSNKLLLLLGMKRSLLRLHLLNELSEPFPRQLVRHAGHKGAVVIDLLVEFGALVTHSSFRIGANSSLDWLPAYKVSIVELFISAQRKLRRCCRELSSSGGAKQRNLKSISRRGSNGARLTKGGSFF